MQIEQAILIAFVQRLYVFIRASEANVLRIQLEFSVTARENTDMKFTKFKTNKPNSSKYYYGNETITKLVCSIEDLLVCGVYRLLQPTLQATSKVSLAGRLEPFCAYDMTINLFDNPRSGDPVLPAIFRFSLQAYTYTYTRRKLVYSFLN